MHTKSTIIISIAILLQLVSFSCAHDTHKSKYAGEEKRAIKSLSAADIEELQKGGGWGLAKAAELNGMPGPAHLLEMKNEIHLSAGQIEAIETIYGNMRNAAVPLGVELIELEDKLNQAFAEKTITGAILKELLTNIARVRKDLRYVHLSAHLKTPDILTPEQITLYNQLRGYASDDPCGNIPKGHDPVKWKKHHDCP